MEKAKTILEVAKRFNPQQPLDETTKEFYVQLYEEKLDQLRTSLLIHMDNPTSSFFILGQSGSGKTTALNFFPDEEIHANFQPIYLPARKLLKLDDVDTVDLLLMIGFQVCENQPFEEEYYAKLEELRKLNSQTLEKVRLKTEEDATETGVKGSIGLKLSQLLPINFSGNFFAGYQKNMRERISAREIMSVDKAELLKVVNDILKRYEEIVLRGEKRILLIIDDLEKMEKVEQIEQLYVTNFDLFGSIECTKIIPVPVSLTKTYSLKGIELFHFNLRLHGNALKNEQKTIDATAKENRENLKQIIHSRLASESIIQPDAVTKIIDYSGGNIRQLVELVYHAAERAFTLSKRKAETITVEYVDQAIKGLSDKMSLSVAHRIGLYKKIRTDFTIDGGTGEEEKNRFGAALLDNSVFSYINGAPWYEVNPLIESTIDVHINRER